MTINNLRLLPCLLLGATLGLTACDDGGNATPKTAKADAKTKADAKADADAKPGDQPQPEADAPKADAPKADAPDADTPEADAPDADASDADDEAFDGYDPRVAQAAKLAQGISTDPQKADELLASASLDREKLDALMYEIANDPDLTEQYRMARGI